MSEFRIPERHARCTLALHSEPGGGTYHRRWSGKFGDEVPVPAPFDFGLTTAELLRY
ncbi:hypothetical protein ACIQ9P_01670 [Kitasatospora sp. NPDC094019]|uniref:hypothetical protein n=1 Tax=Kitasatospora sp. NPDC094019 TaxID=3364091 RepID=UPI0038101887